MPITSPSTPPSLQMSQKMSDTTMLYFHTLYFSTYARLVNLAAGVLLGCVLFTRRAVAAAAARPRLLFATAAAAGLGLATVVFAAPTLAADASRPWRPTAARTFAALAFHGSPLASAAAAGLLACLALAPNALCAAAARVLRHPSLIAAGSLSFHVYLLHIPAMYWAEKYLLPLGWLGRIVAVRPLAGYLLLAVGVYTVGTVAALVHQVLHNLLDQGQRWWCGDVMLPMLTISAPLTLSLHSSWPGPQDGSCNTSLIVGQGTYTVNLQFLHPIISLSCTSFQYEVLQSVQARERYRKLSREIGKEAGWEKASSGARGEARLLMHRVALVGAAQSGYLHDGQCPECDTRHRGSTHSQPLSTSLSRPRSSGLANRSLKGVGSAPTACPKLLIGNGR